MGYVSHLFIAPERRAPMKVVEQVIAIADHGFEGCIHGRRGSTRQVLLVDQETLHEFGLPPGIVRENITTAEVNPKELKTGARLVIGEAVLEVTCPCEPCSRMDEIRMGLESALENRRGTLCRVIRGGRISRGDGIEIMKEEGISMMGGAR